MFHYRDSGCQNYRKIHAEMGVPVLNWSELNSKMKSIGTPGIEGGYGVKPIVDSMRVGIVCSFMSGEEWQCIQACLGIGHPGRKDAVGVCEKLVSFFSLVVPLPTVNLLWAWRSISTSVTVLHAHIHSSLYTVTLSLSPQFLHVVLG